MRNKNIMGQISTMTHAKAQKIVSLSPNWDNFLYFIKHQISNNFESDGIKIRVKTILDPGPDQNPYDFQITPCVKPFSFTGSNKEDGVRVIFESYNKNIFIEVAIKKCNLKFKLIWSNAKDESNKSFSQALSREINVFKNGHQRIF